MYLVKVYNKQPGEVHVIVLKCVLIDVFFLLTHQNSAVSDIS